MVDTRDASQVVRLGQQNEDLTLTASRKVGKQVVFRIKNSRAQPSRALRRPAAPSEDSQSAESKYHTRRPHRKSRAGCANCKKRRVKCDETKPNCQKCETYGISCDYSAVSVRSGSDFRPGAFSNAQFNFSSIDSTLASLSMVDLASQLDHALRLGSNKGSKAPVITTNSKSFFAFNHFLKIDVENAGISDAGIAVFVGDMLKLAFRTPYLMHAVIGAAAADLCRQMPHDRSYKILQAYHFQETILQYQKEIQQGVGKHNMDGLMSACMLLSVVSLPGDQCSPADSWVLTNKATDLNWLLIQGGLRYLLQYTAPYLNESIWFEVFTESDENGTFDDHRAGPEGLLPGFAELCDIHETTTENDNPYHWPLRMASAIVKIPASRQNFSKICGFMGRLLPGYTNLLLARDPRALLILSYWLAKMSERKDWWIYQKVHSECIAICMYLENSSDPRILNLLEFPAEKCGYVLNRVSEVETFEFSPYFTSLF